MKRVLMRSGYAEMLAEGTETELWVYGDIGDSWYDEESVTAKAVADTLAAVTGGTLTVRINSYGGVVADGIAIYNAVRRCQAATKRVEIDGVAMSSASLIAMAADPGECRIAANALLMIHAPWGSACGNAQDLREHADMLDRYARAMASSYARGTVTEADALALLTDGKDHHYTATEAVAAGFCDALSAESLPIAASANAEHLRAAALARYRIPAPTAGVKPTGDTSMPEKTVTPAATVTAPPAAPAPTEAEARAAAQAAITAHIGALDQAFAPLMLETFPHAALVRAEVDRARMDLSATPDQVRVRILAKLGEQTMQPLAAPSYSRATAGEDQRDKTRAAAVDWMLSRAGIKALAPAPGFESRGPQAIDLNGNPFRGATLIQMAERCLRAAGVNPEGMDKMALVAAAFQTSSDFPILFEVALHKVLQNAYRIAPDTWSRWCKTGSVSDFRAHNRYRVGSIGNFDTVNESGEIRRKAIPDGEKGSITADTKGNIIAVTRKAIVNDDLGALMDLATALGRAGKRTIESAAFAMLAENSGAGPTMSDGEYLFSTAHANIEATTVGVPGTATMWATRNKLAAQTDVSGNDILDLSPALWLGPVTLEGYARDTNAAEYSTDAAASTKVQWQPNTSRGLVRETVGTARLTGNPWFLFADPNDAPVIEVAFLDGQQEPRVETKDGWDIDGAELRALLDFGVAAIDYRGAAKNNGG